MIRRGISIIEVLFSIGVIAIGLLGVIAVVPVALRQVGQGQTADAASRIGANAMREFDATGMIRSTIWRRPTANVGASWNVTRYTTVNWSRGTDGVWGLAGDDDSFLVADDPLEAGLGGTNPGADTARNDGLPMSNTSFCIDPRFIASVDQANLQLNMRARSIFPRFDVTDPGGTLRMLRVTLPGSERYGLAASATSLGGMSLAEANKFFIVEDDLIFNVPQEIENPAEQIFLWTQGPDGGWGVAGVNDDGIGNTDDQNEQGWVGSDDIPLTREFEGLFSWMATLVPKPYLPGNIDREYTLSVVVFNRRELDMGSEKIAQISNDASIPRLNFLGQGIGGGDVILESLPLSSRSAAQADVESLRPGQWVMLGGTLANTVGSPFESTFRWYRVVNVGDAAEYNSNTDRYELDVTLAGPDWPVNSTVPNAATQVVIMNSVVAVYERTIRIQTE